MIKEPEVINKIDPDYVRELCRNLRDVHKALKRDSRSNMMPLYRLVRQVVTIYEFDPHKFYEITGHKYLHNLATTLNIKKRTWIYLCSIATFLFETLNGHPQLQDNFSRLQYSRLCPLTTIVTADNADEWFRRACTLPLLELNRVASEHKKSRRTTRPDKELSKTYEYVPLNGDQK